MLEIIMIAAAISFMAKAARIEERSPLAWGGLTALYCIASLALPLPLLRIGIAGIASFATMFVCKIVQAPR